MKSANLPPLRVEASFRSDIEAVLQDGETLSSFVESAVRRAVQGRRVQTEFVARGLGALARVEAGADTHAAEAVVDGLRDRLRQALAAKGLKPGDV
ncbi:MAG: hypothetical protein RI920_2359 [Pseudomonadota bacterium]|jgi:hypothetical protein